MVPLTPIGLSARVAQGIVRIAWNATGSSGNRQYAVYRSLQGGNFVKVGTFASPLYQDSSLPVRTNVRYQVTAVSIYGVESEPTVPVAVTVR